MGSSPNRCKPESSLSIANNKTVTIQSYFAREVTKISDACGWFSVVVYAILQVPLYSHEILITESVFSRAQQLYHGKGNCVSCHMDCCFSYLCNV